MVVTIISILIYATVISRAVIVIVIVIVTSQAAIFGEQIVMAHMRTAQGEVLTPH